jgi:peptidoglycan hydrolase-like protein with peptidoglycan-binding domain
MRSRVPVWVPVAGAVVLVSAVLFVVFGAGGGNGTTPAHHGDSASSPSTLPVALALAATNPASGAQGVPTNTQISVTFTQPVSLRDGAAPTLAPQVAGMWIQSSPTTLTYQLQSPLVPSSHEVVTIPGGSSGLHARDGAALSSPATISFDVAPGDTLRLQQLLAGLEYLPVGFTPSGPAPAPADMAVDQQGSFAWRWPNLPAELTSQWTQGTSNEITRAAVEDFESQNGLGVDGIPGPAVWTALLNDTANNKPSGTPYVYVLVNKALPENLTLWSNGAPQLAGIPVNTGLPGADTPDGNYAVFEHVRFSEMKGTNPDGSHYDDPNVPYASYFNGGDALHGFVRASYGSPQSNGCVEMTYANAAQVWPLTPIGTLVTVVGPNYGSAPPPAPPPPPTTTPTTAPPPPTTTTTAPAPPPATPSP